MHFVYIKNMKEKKHIIYPYGQSENIPYPLEEVSFVVGFDQNGKPCRENFSQIKIESLPASTLIHFSGGIDSTYVLWKWLLENPNDYCVVNHINFNYHSGEDGRSIKQLESVDKILKWLDNQGLNNYYYLQNDFDYGNFTSYIYDVEVCGFFTGLILRSDRWENVTDILLPIYDNKTGREERRRKIGEILSKKSLNYIYPLSGLSKKQVMQELPQELLDMCWYCREPNDGNPCGVCHACESVKI